MNCPKYLDNKKAGKIPPTSSGIFVIEINLATSLSDWVLDIESCDHICSNVQALNKRRSLNKGEMQLHIGNGASIAAVAIGNLELYLPNGLVLKLKVVYFVLSISRNIISISCLDMDGYDFMIKNKCCSIYRDDMFYGLSIMRNGLYLLDLEKPMYNVNNKRHKSLHENITGMWHYRLGQYDSH